jgi:hypothetical protein
MLIQLIESLLASTTAVAALLGALIGGGFSCAGVVLTHIFSSRREIRKEKRTGEALLAVIIGEIETVADVTLKRCNAIARILDPLLDLKGEFAAIFEINDIQAVYQDTSSLGLLSTDVVASLFSLNAAVKEINRHLKMWSEKHSNSLMDESALTSIKELFEQLQKQADELIGLARFKQRSTLGKIWIFTINLIRALWKLLRVSQ